MTTPQSIQQNLLFSTTQLMIHQTIACGKKPACFLMNADSLDILAAPMFESQLNSLSWFDRLLYRNGKKHLLLDKLHGIPVIIDDSFPPGTVFLQTQGQFAAVIAMQGNAPGVGIETKIPPPEFVSTDSQQVQNPDTPTLADITTSTHHGPSPSDIVMKAMDRIDSVQRVIIVRRFDNGDVDLCLNMGVDEAQGLLQRASIYLHQR